MIKIILTGGGTGGHLFPLTAVARKVDEMARSQNLAVEFYYLGPGIFLKEAAVDFGVPINPIILTSGKLRRYFAFENFIDIFKIFFGILESLFKVWSVMPDVIFSKGGYGSIGPVLSGWLYRIPIIIHESDSVPGRTNRFLSRFAGFVAVSFNKAGKFFPEEKTYFTGNPTRDGFFNSPEESERQLLSLKSSKPLIFIEGSSQGSQSLNDLTLTVLPDLLAFAEIIHQTGLLNYEEVVRESKVVLSSLNQDFYHPIAFLSEKQMTAAFHQAYLIVGRAGAGTIFEIAAAAKPSILIPLPSAASDHQRHNAYVFAEGGRAEVIEEANLTPQLFLSRVRSFVDDVQKTSQMANLSGSFAVPDASKIIAQALINLAS